MKYECVDTAGDPIKRVGAQALQQVLDDPRLFGGEKAPDYALVYCRELGVYIMREGYRIDKAKFYLCSVADHVRIFEGPAGRDEAIQLFLRMLGEKRSYWLHPKRVAVDAEIATRHVHPQH